MERAWVMIVRKRGATFSELETKLDKLKESEPSIKKVMPVYGYYDVIVPVEAKDHVAIQEVILKIRDAAPACIRKTTTYLGIDQIDSVNDDPWRENLTFPVCIGVNCEAGEHGSVLDSLSGLNDQIVVADRVFGDFDIIVLADGDGHFWIPRLLEEIVKHSPAIDKTTVMIGLRNALNA